MGAAHVEHLRQERELINRFLAELKANLDKRSPRSELRHHRTYGANLESLIVTIARHSDLDIIRAPTK